MEFIKKNTKLIITFILGIIVASGITAYATYNYFAKDINYTKSNGAEITVEQALNELYEMKKDYIKPNGTKTITEKSSQIDVSSYRYADTTWLYTASEIQSGEGIFWDKTTKVVGQDKICEIDLEYVPSFIFIKANGNFSDFVFYSYDSCNTFYRIRTDTNSVDINQGTFSLSGTKITATFGGDSWKGTELDIYAIK